MSKRGALSRPFCFFNGVVRVIKSVDFAIRSIQASPPPLARPDPAGRDPCDALAVSALASDQ
jgi:hypothetical protein